MRYLAQHEVLGCDQPIYRIKPKNFFQIKELDSLSGYSISAYLEHVMEDEEVYEPLYSKKTTNGWWIP